MKKVVKKACFIALGVAAGCAVACLVVHRRVVVAAVKGQPLPELPAWHTWHGCCK